MLVLERKSSEKIFIGDNIVLTVVKIDRGRVKLGIEAPENVKILRSELKQQDADDLAEAEAEAERIRKEAGIRF